MAPQLSMFVTTVVNFALQIQNDKGSVVGERDRNKISSTTGFTYSTGSVQVSV